MYSNRMDTISTINHNLTVVIDTRTYDWTDTIMFVLYILIY